MKATAQVEEGGMLFEAPFDPAPPRRALAGKSFISQVGASPSGAVLLDRGGTRAHWAFARQLSSPSRKRQGEALVKLTWR
jgi:hypothetical protein